MLRLFYFSFITLLSSQLLAWAAFQAYASDNVSLMRICDELASVPSSPDTAEPGVSLNSIDATNAVSACREAVVETNGSARAHFNLARALIAAENFAGARENAEVAVSKGYEIATVVLGYLEASSKDNSEAQFRATKLYERAAKAGLPLAAYALAIRLSQGLGASPDQNSALKWLRFATERDFPPALNESGRAYLNGSLVRKDLGISFKYFSRAAELQYGPAMINLAGLYEGKDGVGRDLRKAEKILLECIKINYEPCHLALGRLYSWHGQTIEDYRRAEKHLRIAYKNNPQEAAADLGLLLDDVEELEANEREIFELISVGADKGLLMAKVRLGELLIEGKGAGQDVALGLGVIEEVAQENFKEAFLSLAEIYTKGLGVPVSIESAAEWLQKAASAGHKRSAYKFASLIIEEKLKDHLPEDGISMMEKLAYQGYSDAQWYLGFHNRWASDPENLEEAVKWYRMGAESGDMPSKLAYGEMLARGQGIQGDEKLGLEIMKSVAETGDLSAQGDYGEVLLSISQHEEGRKWLRKAVKSGNKYDLTSLGAHLLQFNPSSSESDEGVRYLELAAKQDYAYAMSMLGRFYKDGIGVKRDIDVALKWLKRASQLGDAYGALLVGNIYNEPILGRVDYKKAYKWFSKAAELGSLYANVNLGFAHQTGLGVPRDFIKARKFYEIAAKEGDPVAIASLAALGATGQIPDLNIRTSLAMMDKALEIIEVAGPEYEVQKASIYENYGYFQNIRGRFVDAEKYYLKALKILEQQYGQESINYINSLGGFASLQEQSGRFERARDRFQEAFSLLEKLEGDTSHIEYSLKYNRALLHEAEEEYEAAIEIFDHLLSKLRWAIGIDTNLQEGSTHAALARNYLAMSRLGEAEKHFQQAYEHLQSPEIQGHPEFLRLNSDYARLKTQQKSYKEAIDIFSATYQRAKEMAILDHPLVSIATAAYSEALIADGQIDRAIGVIDEIQSTYISRLGRQSRETLSDLGSERQVIRKALERQLGLLSQLKSNIKGSKRPDIDKLSFQTVQLMGVASASSAISQMAARFAAGDNNLAKLARERQNLLVEWNELNIATNQTLKQSATASVVFNPTVIASALDEVEKKITEIDNQLIANYPEYYQLSSTNPSTISETQNLLKDDEALVVFSIGTSTSYVLLVKKDGFDFIQIDINEANLRDAVRQLRLALSPNNVSSLGDIPPFNQTLAFDLYRSLLAPISSQLDNIRLLLTVSNGPLESLPLGVLITDEPEKEFTDFSGYRQTPWLAKKYALSVIPSVSSLKSLREFAKQSIAGKPFLGFGDPDLDGHSGSRGQLKLADLITRNGLANVDRLRDLGGLPDTADEIREIAKTLNADEDSIYLGARATETIIKNLNLSEARVISFATHGLLAGEIDGLVEPGLVLTPPKEPTEIDDGYLSASEIGQLNLNADWVILSACNTAAPNGNPEAEGLSGLAQAFFYAGSRSLLVSHWPVISDAAKKLTTLMFKQTTEKGVGKAKALQIAMLSFFEETTPPYMAHPLFWAPFSVVGEPN